MGCWMTVAVEDVVRPLDDDWLLLAVNSRLIRKWLFGAVLHSQSQILQLAVGLPPRAKLAYREGRAAQQIYFSPVANFNCETSSLRAKLTFGVSLDKATTPFTDAMNT